MKNTLPIVNTSIAAHHYCFRFSLTQKYLLMTAFALGGFAPVSVVYADTATCSTARCVPELRSVGPYSFDDSLAPELDYNGNSNASGNRVTVTGVPASVERIKGAYGAFRDDNAALENNQVKITGGKVYYVYGASSSGEGNVNHNSVNISGGYVGYVTSGYENGRIYGGTSSKGNASGNQVTMTAGTVVGSIYGAWAKKAAKGNRVIMQGGEVTRILGANSEATASENYVTMSAGQVDYLSAAYAGRDKAAKDNHITITGGEVVDIVRGGISYDGHSYDNTITITGNSKVGGNVWAGQGYTINGDVLRNKVRIDGSAYIRGSVYGGAYGYNVKDNTVTIDGGIVEGSVMAGKTFFGIASKNTAILKSGKGGGIYGGFADYDHVIGGPDYEIKSHANANTAIMEDGEVITLCGGASLKGNANGNTAIMQGGEAASITGGRTNSTIQHAEHTANNNKVIISGGHIKNSVYGGLNIYRETAKNNSVTLKRGRNGNPTFGQYGQILGSYSHEAEPTKTGNTFNMQTRGMKLLSIRNFEKLNFYLQTDTAANNKLLTLTNAGWQGTIDTDITGAKVGVCVEGSNTALKHGDEVVLIEVENGNLLTDAGNLINTITGSAVTGMQGCSSDYAFTLRKESKKLIAVVTRSPNMGNTLFMTSFE